MRIANSLADLSPKEQDRIAWIDRDDSSQVLREWTWRQIQAQSIAAANFLRQQGVGPKDPVASIAKNSINWAVLDFACSILNAIHCPIDFRQPAEVQRYCVELLDAKCLFEDALQQNLEEAPYRESNSISIECLSELPSEGLDFDSVLEPASPQDVANVLFTTGTSGKPKGVMLSHDNLISNALAKLDAMPQLGSDHRLNFLPFSHAYARTCELTTWLLSRSSMETVQGIEGALKRCSICSPTLLNGVPIFFERLAEEWEGNEASNSSSLKVLLGCRIRQLACGGAPLSEPLRERFAWAGFPVYQGYGLTEASPVVCSNRARAMIQKQSDLLLQGVGPVVKGVDIRIDEEARLWVRGTGVMLGYWKDQLQTLERIQDGWLDTQDLAERIDGDAIRILGRADDTIVLSNGLKLNPGIVEQVLLNDDCFKACIVIGDSMPFPTAILTLDASVADQGNAFWTDQVRSSLVRAGMPTYAIQAFVVQNNWRDEPQFINFKGGIRRKVIEKHFRTEVERQLREVALR